MGANQSGGVSIGGSSMGYQVLRVYPNSPGSEAGLKAYFDFIVAIGNTRFDKEDGSLREILKASVDQKLKMIVYNTRSKTAREVDVVPTTRWGGSGLLGVSIKHSSFDRADERVWHVVEVDPGSPAHQAGFKANEDYVIGSDSVLQENDDLYNLIEAHENRALKLFVYNVKTDNCREVICHPNSKWGGRGYLGCEFGHGLLHRIPYADYQNADDPRQPLISSQEHQQQQQQQQQQLPQHQPPQQQQQPTQPQPRQPTFSPSTFQDQAVLQQSQRNQPGYQLLQQALFDKSPRQQSSMLTNNSQSPTDGLPPPLLHHQQAAPQQQQAPRPEAAQTFVHQLNAQNQLNASQHQQQLPPPPQQAPQAPASEVPQTFAQLASAQYQASPSPQQQQSPPLLPLQPQHYQQAAVQQTQQQGPPMQVAQTFAQLASAQYQMNPSPQQHQQPELPPPPPQQQQQQQQQQLPPPPPPQQPQQSPPYEVPQTFAQLAGAQCQMSPGQQQQHSPPPMLPPTQPQQQQQGPPVQVPQTFAQLASTQYQMSPNQQQGPQQQPQPPPQQQHQVEFVSQ